MTPKLFLIFVSARDTFNEERKREWGNNDCIIGLNEWENWITKCLFIYT